MFDYLLKSSQWGSSNKWLNIGFGEEIGIEEKKMYLCWCPDNSEYEGLTLYSQISISPTRISRILRNSKRRSESKILFDCFLKP